MVWWQQCDDVWYQAAWHVSDTLLQRATPTNKQLVQVDAYDWCSTPSFVLLSSPLHVASSTAAELVSQFMQLHWHAGHCSTVLHVLHFVQQCVAKLHFSGLASCGCYMITQRCVFLLGLARQEYGLLTTET